MQVELLYFTVIHTCEHVGCKPYRRNDPKVKLMQMYTITDERTIYSPHPCKVCAQLAVQAAERRAANPPENTHIRYMVDGKPMSVEQDRVGHWRGRRIEHGQKIVKYFGKVDPRPDLVEVL